MSDLTPTIMNKLPAGALDQVCANAPEGSNANGETYKDLCQKCLIDTSGEKQRACVAGVVADFVESQNQN